MIQGNGSELGNYVSNFATPGQEGFSGPFPLMRWLWSESTLKGLRKCHRVRYGPSVEVFAGADGEVFFVGYCRCHGVWCCPLCAPMIRRGRARELSAFLASNAYRGVTLDIAGCCSRRSHFLIVRGIGWLRCSVVCRSRGLRF